MTKRMLMDATHPEETRVAIVDSYRDNHRLEDLDYDLASKPILRGNIYLAKVMRIEPSLQAAFVDYGNNRHGFLPFSEIHPDYFRIPIADRSDLAEDDESSEAAFEKDEDQSEDEGETAPLDVEGFDPVACAHESGTMPEHAIAMPHEDVPVESLPQSEPAPIPERAMAERIAAAPAGGMSGESFHIFGTTGPDSASDPHQDTMSGLITDFGNAVVPTPAPLLPPLASAEGVEALPVSDQPVVESLGGEVSERVVRQHRPRYKIQEVLKRGQIMLIQVVKEERGNKGAALTTFLSLAGRYCVLMPNTDHGGGVSRKITNHQDRRRMKEVLDQLEIPDGMAVILRTAGMEQDPPEIQRDLEYLLRLWDNIREQTLQSTAPSLIYEEANLIKRSVRDLYTQDIQEILVAGRTGYERARDFMRTIMPDQVEKIKIYEDSTPLFFRYHVDSQVDTLHSPIVQLKSGGYLVINPTEALVSIDVNSGRATRERHIEETAVKTNLEAADEIARQLRLRDLAGLVVIDFIDMEDGRNNSAVERRLKEAMKNDRARLQIGRISPFGLMELSRQRLRPSLLEINYEKCPHCAGTGYVRSPDSAALSVLRLIEEEGIKQRAAEITVTIPTSIALYILNHKREALGLIEKRYDLRVLLHNDDTALSPSLKVDRARNRAAQRVSGPAVNTEQVFAEAERDMPNLIHAAEALEIEGGREEDLATDADDSSDNARGRGRRNNRRLPRQRRDRHDKGGHGGSVPSIESRLPSDVAPRAMPATTALETEASHVQGETTGDHETVVAGSSQEAQDQEHRRRRRGRRGGRRRNGHENHGAKADDQTPGEDGQAEGEASSAAHPLNQGATESAPQGGGKPVSGPRDQRPRHPPHEVRPRHPHPQGGQDQRRGRTPQGDQGPVPARHFDPAQANVRIPTSIHEIDTTPKPFVPVVPPVVPPMTTVVPSAPATHVSKPVHTPIGSATGPALAATTVKQRAPAQQEQPQRSYEIVNPPPEKQKGGWWRRLTGQE